MADETTNSNTPGAPYPSADPLATSVTPAEPLTVGGGGAASYATSSTPPAEEARSRFNAALEEAKAGASALKEEAAIRAASYRDQALDKGDHWSSEAKLRAGDLAAEGKAKASGALLGLSRLVDENAVKIDESFGPKYGDYARNASRSLRDTADTIERKSIDELGEDARSFVRDQPAMAVGLAAVAGLIFARMFRK